MRPWDMYGKRRTNTKEEKTMDRGQVIKELKDILANNETITDQQENALIIAIAELLKEWCKC